MLLIEAPDVGAPAHVQVRRARTRPPQPQLLPGAAWSGQAAHLHEDQRAADDRAGLAGAAGRMVLLLGMQPGPRPSPHGAILRILRTADPPCIAPPRARATGRGGCSHTCGRAAAAALSGPPSRAQGPPRSSDPCASGPAWPPGPRPGRAPTAPGRRRHRPHRAAPRRQRAAAGAGL